MTLLCRTYAAAALTAALAAPLALADSAAPAMQPRNEPITPIAPAVVQHPAMVALGKQLWFDPRLSRSGAISCNSCHNLSMGGSDNLPTSVGHRWAQGPIHAPTVLNASLNFAQFWDGRANTLKEQAASPIVNPQEMAFTHALAVHTLNTIPGYQRTFAQVFGSSPITLDQATDAIAAFESTLVTPGARFDRWLQGDNQALTADELTGYRLFRDSGCTNCHNGPAVGGNSFQRMGQLAPYATRNPSLGRADVTGNDADRLVFKVPTLRNIALTAPYFHDGAVHTLSEAVDTMARIQLGKTFTPQEIAQVVAFLHTLTGEQPQITLPQLPPSGEATPRPQPFAPAP